MKISRSIIGYKQKPVQNEYWKLRFKDDEVSINQLYHLLTTGHAMLPPMNIQGEYILKGLNKKELFAGTNVVSVDLDDIPFGWTEVKALVSRIQPTLMYATFSDGLDGKGHRYRLIYVFNQELNASEYELMYYFIVSKVKEAGIEVTDNCGHTPWQLMHGTSSSYTKLYYTEPFSINNFHGFDPSKVEIPDLGSKKTLVRKSPTAKDDGFTEIVEASEGIIRYADGSVDKIDLDNIKPREVSSMMVNNAECMPYEEFMETYHNEFPIIYRVEKDEWVDGKWQWIDDGYFKICYHKKKIKDGEHRRRKLFTRAALRKVIKPDITPDQSFYNLYSDLHKFIDNSNDYITITDLVGMANRVERLDADQLKEDYSGMIKTLQQNNPKCGRILHRRFNKDYNHTMSTIRKEEVLAVYDYSLSVVDNLEILNDSGFDISKATLMRYLNGNGNRKHKDEQITKLLDMTQSAYWNYTHLKLLGYKVGVKKVYKLYESSQKSHCL